MPVDVYFSDPDRRRVIAKYMQPVDFVGDVRLAMEKIVDLLRQVNTFPAFVLIDVQDLKDLKFSDIVIALGEIGRAEVGQAYLQYDARTIYVGTGDLVRITAESLKQEQYGAYTFIEVVESLEEANALIDKQLAGS
jgi:hypothetical protein